MHEHGPDCKCGYMWSHRMVDGKCQDCNLSDKDAPSKRCEGVRRTVTVITKAAITGYSLMPDDTIEPEGYIIESHEEEVGDERT